MVVVTFLVEFNDDNKVSVPVGISDSRSKEGHPRLKDYISRLREKLGISSTYTTTSSNSNDNNSSTKATTGGGGKIDLRHKDMRQVHPSVWNPEKESYLYALVDEPASEKALLFRENMRRTIRTNSMIGASPMVVEGTAKQHKFSSSSSNPNENKQQTNNNNNNDPEGLKRTGVTTLDPSSGKPINTNNNNNNNNSSRIEVLEEEDGHSKSAAAAASKSDDNYTDLMDDQHKEDDDDDDDDEDDPRGGDHLLANEVVHFISHGSKSLSTTLSKVAQDYGKIICKEFPQLAPMYPSSLVDLVRRDPHLHVWPHLVNYNNKSVEKVAKSPLSGVGDAEFSLLLYAAKRRGHVLPCKNDEEATVAFYSNIDSIPHSCAPTCLVRYRFVRTTTQSNKTNKTNNKKKKDDEENKSNSSSAAAASHSSDDDEDNEEEKRKKEQEELEKNPAILRCIKFDGLTAADPLTVCLPRVATMDFFLLPTLRRRKYLQQMYSVIDPGCVCPRCTGRVSTAAAEMEHTLTGGFFGLSSKKSHHLSNREQQRITSQMHKEFENLGILFKTGKTNQQANVESPMVLSKDAREGKIPSENIQKIYDFLKKYTLTKKEQQQHSSSGKQQHDSEKKVDETTTTGEEKEAEQEQQQQSSSTSTSPLQLHSNHWRLSFCRIALLAFLFPPHLTKLPNSTSTASKKQQSSLPIPHPTVKLDRFVAKQVLSQLDVESACLTKYSQCAHPLLGRSYLVFRALLGCLPEKPATDVQRDARKLENVDWPMIEKIAVGF